MGMEVTMVVALRYNFCICDVLLEKLSCVD